MTDKKLLISAITKFVSGIAAVLLLVFLPAGTLHYPNGRRLIALLFIPMLLLGGILYLKAPHLLKKRLSAKEKQAPQKLVVAASGLIFLLGFAICGLDFRYGWSYMPDLLINTASVLFLLSYGLYAEVMRENAYLSRTVTVQKGQKVVDTGLYGIVRHPMYAATILMFLSIPIILGSFYGLLIFLMYPLLLAVRIIDEERLLERKLAGYAQYKKRVKYRLIPFIW